MPMPLEQSSLLRQSLRRSLNLSKVEQGARRLAEDPTDSDIVQFLDDDDDYDEPSPPAHDIDEIGFRLLHATGEKQEQSILSKSLRLGPRLELETEVEIPTRRIGGMIGVASAVLGALWALLAVGTRAVGPPRQPVGGYRIVEAQVGEDLFQYYDFYAGRDSAGSNGYNTYVSREVAEREEIVRVLTEVVGVEGMIEVYEEGEEEVDWLEEDKAFLKQLKIQKAGTKKNGAVQEEGDAKNGVVQEEEDDTDSNEIDTESKTNTTRRLENASNTDTPQPKLQAFNPDLPSNNANASSSDPTETFVILSSGPTQEGPRNSIRLEGRKRFNRGLFIIDLRHMPAGCGTWPAFWLTDEANWPVNGEIDIVEGVNYQDTAKTALHTTRECRMDDVPDGIKTGTWDTAVGIPDKKTGIPDMTFRFAQDCFVYDPHQWINQGCVASDLKLEGRSLGVPLNDSGGGVYALEWDPINTHIRTWVFSPHGRVPRNLREALRTATREEESERVAPDTSRWGLPYGHFPIGEGTNCPSEHFRNMRLVINLAFCGSVSGTRYFMDCPKQFEQFKTCEEWLESDPDELKEAYWKIRGIYVYEREWQKQWS